MAVVGSALELREFSPEPSLACAGGDPFALTTDSYGPSHPDVLRGEGVSTVAVRPPHVSTALVLGSCDGIKVVRANAEFDLAEMVEFQVFKDRSDQQGVSVPVSHHGYRRARPVVTAPLDLKLSVTSSVAVARIQPTVLGFCHHGPEAFLGSASGLQIQGAPFVLTKIVRRTQAASRSWPLAILGSTQAVRARLLVKVGSAQRRADAYRRRDASLSGALFIHRLTSALSRVVRRAQAGLVGVVFAGWHRASHEGTIAHVGGARWR